MHRYFLLVPLFLGACNCAPPTVVHRKIVAVSTTIVYQVGEEEGMATSIHAAADAYHDARVRTVDGGQTTKKGTPLDGAPKPPTGSSCSEYVYSKEYSHIEQSYEKGNNKKSEDITSDATEVVCVY